MGTLTKIHVLSLCLVLSLLGCAHRNLPQDIYVGPQHKYYHPLNVGIFQFVGPSNAPATGEAAAYYLYTRLSEQNVFSNITFERNIAVDATNVIKTMKAKKYDMIIIGNLLHYAEGGDFQSSHVEEHMWAIRRVGNRAEILLYAKALETRSPVASVDYLIFNTEGSPAPSASTLLKMNATKFGNLLMAAFSRR